jgi:glycosyltransferase involved in cell wall biosynthesis/ADP-heptose:LPS heptosyltransferase/predicted Zn-dependent protease/GT2 family glycosyltransferase
MCGPSVSGPGDGRAPARSVVDLPVHFFTIVLNGKPFIEHHIKAFERLPFEWHWHIIEGVAELNHDTAWSKQHGGRVASKIHRHGLSRDGTAEYLDELAEQFPKKITLYRKGGGAFWDGKLEMVNAPLAKICEECLLWQIDADELWATEQLITARNLFLAHPEKTAAFYHCHYFVGENLVITTRNTYGNNTGYEWIRTWRFTPGCRWLAHEPPRLCRPAGNGQWSDLAAIAPLRHADTEAAGLVFQHFAYATPEQLEFKETYYGYAGALQQWTQLQRQRQFPVALKAHFAWVKDEARVNTAESQRILPLAAKDKSGKWTFLATQPAAEVKRILFVRTDAIGDAVIAAPMLPLIRSKYPDAKIAVLCREHVADLYLACPFVGTVICFDWKKVKEDEKARREIVQQIAQFKPDLILNSLYSREAVTEVLIHAQQAPHVMGLEGNLSNISARERADFNGLYTRLLPSPGDLKPELGRHRDFLTGLGIEVHKLEPQVWTSIEDEALAKAFFMGEQLDPSRTIALFPGSQHDWKVYPRMAEGLRELTGCRFLIFGGAEVAHAAEELAARLPGPSINLCGKTTLREMAALFRKCRLYVGADSAGAHIACAVGLPNVVVLGGGHFGRFLPYSPLTSVACLPLECYGCNWACKFPTVHCVKNLDPIVVAEAIRQTLSAASNKPRVFMQDRSLWLAPTNFPRWKSAEPFLAVSGAEIITVSTQSDARRRDPIATHEQNDKPRTAFLPLPGERAGVRAGQPTGSVLLPAGWENGSSDFRNLAAALVQAASGLEPRQRVLSIISRLEKDYWLERNLKMYADTITPWFDAATFLNWFARAFRPRTYLEVGVRRGRSMAQVLVESPATQAFGFDLWIPDYGSVPSQGIHTTNPGPDFVRSELRKLGVANPPALIVGDSHETLPKFFADPKSPAQFDLIFIDGDHARDGAKLDLSLAFDHLAPGGALVFDDIDNPSHLDLRDLWNEYKAKFPDHLFIEHSHGAGTGVAFRPPFDRFASALATPSSTTSPAQSPVPLSSHARACLDAAEHCFNTGHLAAAARHLERAVEQAPDSVELLSALGNLHFQLDDLPAARQAFRKAVSRRSDDALLHVLLANVCLRLGNAEEFESALSRALQLEPENISALRLLADLNLQHGRFADAARGYAALLRQAPQDIGVLLGLAGAFEGAGDLDTARAACEEALKFHPDHSETRALLDRLNNQNTPRVSQRAAQPADGELIEQTVQSAQHVGNAIQPLVSVIVSAYAAEKYIRACLADLVAQTIFDKLEIIVIDSGSPQNERAIVEEFQKRHSNIRYYRTERETLYAAWNRAIGLARGKYIANANCDDAHRSDALEKLAAALEAHPGADLAYGDYYTSSVPNDSFTHPDILRHVVHPPYHPATVMMYCVTGCHPMWRRTVFDKLGLFDPTYTAPGDYEFLFRFVQAGLRAVHVPEPLSLFFQNPEGLSWKSAAQSKNENDRILGQYRSHMPIERLYAVDPSDATSISLAWTALGNLAMQHEVPWFSNYVQDLGYGRFCYEQALKADSSNVAAGQNLVVARLLQQRSIGDRSFLDHFPADVADALRCDIERGQLRLASVEIPPAVQPIEFGERMASRDVPSEAVLPIAWQNRPTRNFGGVRPSSGAETSRGHKLPQFSQALVTSGDSAPEDGRTPVQGRAGQKSSSSLSLPVRLAASFLHQSGATGDALNLAASLARRIDLATFDYCEPYSRSFDEQMPEDLRALLRGSRTRFNFSLRGVGIAWGGADDLKRVRDANWNIARTSFAADRLPVEWVRTLNQMDEIWVPSGFHAEAFTGSGVERDKLVVVPSAVDDRLFDPVKHEPLSLPNRAAFNFLAVFEWRARKGWDALLAAYLREFSAEDDVCLYLRTSFPRLSGAASRAALEQGIRELTHTLNPGAKKLPRIELLTEEIPLTAMPRLYRAAECVVASSRGEAWGRVPLEAMMMGLPVIATNWGIHADILSPEIAYPLDSDLVSTTNLELDEWQYHGQRWAEPSGKHLRELLRRVQQDPAKARERGAKAREQVRKQFSSDVVADLILKRLQAIEEKLTKPACLPVKSSTTANGQSPNPQSPIRNRQSLTVALEGSFLDFGSLSHVNRELSRQLSRQAGVSLTCIAKNIVPPELAHERSLVETARRLKYPAPKGTQVTIRHAWPPNWERPASGKWVLVQPWEFGVLPEEWVQRLETVDEIWAPSEYVRRVYVESGVDPRKVHVVPNGIDPELFRPNAKPMPLATRKKFKFLFVGGTIPRKGPDLLLKAYLERFTVADDVCLVIKDFGGQSVYAGQTFESQIRATQSRSDAPEILYLNKDLSPESLPGLYTACDCLVHPYRGEGFGLPVLEAMACGLPVIVTGGGSTDDFATDDFAYRLPALRKSLGPSVSGLRLVREGWMLEPDLVALGERMKHVIAHRDEALAKGRAASEHVRCEWTWERAARIAAQRVRQLANREDPSRIAPPQRSSKPLALPPVARIGHLAEARALFSDGELKAAWMATAAALEARPFHPEAFLLLAEIARAAGETRRSRNSQNTSANSHRNGSPRNSSLTVERLIPIRRVQQII